jgi:large subunit ribosomal protein L4
MVRGGGKKPFRQKGTGNARQGSSRSPLMPGGGSNFGPQPRSYNQSTPRAMIRGALRSVLSDKLASSRLVIVDKFDLKQSKTKDLVATLTNTFKVEKAVLVDSKNRNLQLASRNIPTVSYLSAENINTYDLVKHEWLFLTKDTVQALASRLA